MILDGKIASTVYKKKLSSFFKSLKDSPKLVVIQVKPDSGSESYLKSRIKLADELGVQIEVKKFEDISEEDLIKVVKDCNSDKSVNAIMIDRPLPKTMDELKIYGEIQPNKDIDGCSPLSAERLLNKKKCLVPSTAQAVVDLLDFYNIEVKNKEITIVGRSKSVGAPLATLLRNRGANITVCHSQTIDLVGDCYKAEILIVAMGKQEYIKQEHINKNAVVVDVGIHRDEEGYIVGDIERNALQGAASYSPVPGGVGPLTTVGLFRNLAKIIEEF